MDLRFYNTENRYLAVLPMKEYRFHTGQKKSSAARQNVEALVNRVPTVTVVYLLPTVGGRALLNHLHTMRDF